MKNQFAEKALENMEEYGNGTPTTYAVLAVAQEVARLVDALTLAPAAPEDAPADAPETTPGVNALAGLEDGWYLVSYKGIDQGEVWLIEDGKWNGDSVYSDGYTFTRAVVSIAGDVDGDPIPLLQDGDIIAIATADGPATCRVEVTAGSSYWLSPIDPM